MKMTEQLFHAAEHLLFAAFMLPTLVVLLAAAVSLALADPSAPVPPQLAAAQFAPELLDMP